MVLIASCHVLQVLADVLGAEAAMGRIQFVSGTHAIATALYALLRPGDELLAVAGRWASVCMHCLTH
jgi:cystathionine beta-lyase family protein involved in aluminum resistance